MKNIKETVSDYIQNVRQSLSTLEVPDKEKEKQSADSWLKQAANGQTPEENAITKKYNDYVFSLQDVLSTTKNSKDPKINSIPIQTRKQIFNDIMYLFKKQNKAVKTFALFEQEKIQQRASYDFKKLFEKRKNYNLPQQQADYIYKVLQTWASNNGFEIKTKSDANSSFDFGTSRAMDESIIKRWKILADIK